jgi:glutathione S-transferase
MFLAEKGVQLETREVNLMNMEHMSEGYVRINPLRAVPALQLDDGAVLTESVAICRYIEFLHPEPALFGRGGREQAFVEMWQRRAEFGLFAPVAQAFRHSHPRMGALENPQFPDFAEAQRPRAVRMMRFLDNELAGRRFIAGAEFTIADITAYVATELTKLARIEIPAELTRLLRWRDEIAARPGAAA